MTPTTADPPPKLGGKEMLSEDYQNRAFSLLSIASVSGCCQVKYSLSLFLSLFVCVSGPTVSYVFTFSYGNKFYGLLSFFFFFLFMVRILKF